jgi:NAD(P)-dependent dehydrogenase (short-subunit alcohol dehydrogenase family)
MQDSRATQDSFHPEVLAGEHVVVTGGGTGLGKAMAAHFARLGAKVTICGRRTEPLDETVEEIESAGGEAEGISCNVRDAEAVEHFFGEAEDRQGPVTRLVNNAAANFLSTSEDLSPNGFDAIIKTNLYGSFYCTQACGRRWLEREEGGVVLSIATTYAETGSAFVLPSAMSKAGIVAMTKSLAAEWGSAGIRLNAVGPGPFPTEGAWSRLSPPGMDLEEQMRQRVPLRRFGEPEELANLAVFMLSDLSSYMNGAFFAYDGGEVLVAGGQFNQFTQMPREQIKQLFEQMRPDSDE